MKTTPSARTPAVVVALFAVPHLLLPAAVSRSSGSEPAARLVKQIQKIQAGDLAVDSNFGGAVDISGDTMVVGAPFDDANGNNAGAAYVFVRNGLTWTQQTKLIAGDTTGDDQYGTSVSINRDLIVVGAPFHDHLGGGNFDDGSAYLYRRTGTTWNLEDELIASDAANNDRFGTAVDIGIAVPEASPSSDELFDVIVGAPVRISPMLGGPQGAIYLYELSPDGTTWSELGIFEDDGPIAGQLGWSVAISGDRIIGGAPFDNQFGTESGAAYVFARTNITNTWGQSGPKVTAPDAAPNELFGRSVDVQGVLDFGQQPVRACTSCVAFVVGAPANSSSASPGAAYVFGSGVKLTADDGDDTGDRFGRSVAIFNNDVMVGAPEHDSPTDNEGAAYLFERAGLSWSQVQKITADDAATRDELGFAVAIGGQEVIAGARSDDESPLVVDVGSVYAFRNRSLNLFNADLAGWGATAPTGAARR